MSKLDELDKKLGEEIFQIIGILLKSYPNADVWSRDYLADTDKARKRLKALPNFARKYYEAGKVEEREALKKAIGNMEKEITTDYRDNNEYSQGYNNALEDLLNELNKN